MTSPPYLDEHAVVIAADVDDVWRALLETLDRNFSRALSARYAWAIRCADHAAAGPRPLTEGSTIPGFRVATAIPGSELVLAGKHYFSDYELIFRLAAINPGQSRLVAESWAAFPGLPGRAYRLLVVGTGGHVVAVRRLLSAIATRAEMPPAKG
ncbi:MAG TPA: hypothetical protein VLL08_21840 [Kineosporiaceae bacterium]|nr:hypothetical protein [Kineosporiaceae bacterium]